MDKPQTIFVPVDLSERAALAVEYAGMLAADFGSRLVLFTNVDLPERAILEEATEGTDTTILEAAGEALERIGHERAPGVACTTDVRFDDFPGEGILKAIDRADADLVIIASHGRTGVGRWLLGSVAEKIARASPVPVLIMPVRDT